MKEKRVGETYAVKAWYQSTTIWSLLASVFAKLLAIIFQVEIDDAMTAQLTSSLSLGASFVADFIALRGRVNADKPIG